MWRALGIACAFLAALWALSGVDTGHFKLTRAHAQAVQCNGSAGIQRALTFGGAGCPSGGAPAYTGPGDVVSSATGFWALRGYNAAYATGSNNAADIRCNATNFTALKILSSGDFDIATAISDCGASSYAVFQGTIASSTLTVTSGPTHGTIATGQHLFCVGCPDNLTISSGSGTTWTVSATATVSSAVQMNASAITIQKLYDQSGNAHDLTPWFTNQGPFLVPYFSGNLPTLFFDSAGSFGLHNAAFATVAQPFTLYAISARYNAFTTTQSILGFNSNAAILAANSTANQVFIDAGTFFGATASDQAMHVVSGTFTGSTTSSIQVDATRATGTNPGAGTIATNIGFGAESSSGALFLQGPMPEGAIWPSDIGSTVQTSLCHNAFTYWGTSTSC